MKTKMIAVFLFLLLIGSACNVPFGGEGQDLGFQAPDSTPPQITGVTPSAFVLHGTQCMPEGLEVDATVAQDPSGISGVVMRYRLVGDSPNQETGWLETALSLVGDAGEEFTYSSVLPQLGDQAMDLFDDGWGSLDFQVLATDGAGNQSAWPANDPHSSLVVSPCDLVTDLDLLDGDLSEQFTGYGPGCSPSSTTFSLMLGNYGSLEKAWVDLRYYTGEFDGPQEPASEPMELILVGMGESEEFPGVQTFSAVVDIQQAGNTYLGGQDGLLHWRMYAKDVEGGVESWPPGDSQPVFIESCELGLASQASATPTFGPIIAVPLVTPTSGQLGLAPLPTATPTLGLILVADAIEAQASDVTMFHDTYIDLDTGTLLQSAGGNADFWMASVDDPYLDYLITMNGSYIGWYGQGSQPGKQGCIGTLKSTSSMMVDWPDHKDSYYCYETSEGRQGWLKVQTFVSQPLFERRLIFSFTTYK